MQLLHRRRATAIPFESRHDGEEERTFARRRDELDGNEHVLTALQRPDRFRQDADDGVAGAVELNGLADSIRASAEMLLPERPAENDGERPAGLPVLLGEVSADRGLHAEHGEIRPRHAPTLHALGDGAVGVCHHPRGVRRDLLELGLLRSKREIVGDRERESVRRRVGVDTDEPAGIRVWQRSQERCIDRREDHRRRADAEPDRDDDRQRRHGRAQQTAKSDAQILQEVFDP